MYVLGISAYYHDSAACLVEDGNIVSAAQEERFSRIKHDAGFPHAAIRSCLEQANITMADVELVAFYEKPRLKFDRLIKTYLAYAPVGFPSFVKAIPLWVKQKFWIEREIRRFLGFTGDLVFPAHHESHAASAFFPSPFPEAAFLTMDGVGEWTTTSFGVGEGNRIQLLKEIRFPHSLGLLYSAFTYYTGFKVNSGEYKLMGLAPYGDPRYVDLIYEKLIDVKDDGSFRLNMDYFGYCTGFTMTNERFDRLLGRPPRKPEGPVTQMDMDLAQSIQVVTEEIILRIVKNVHAVTGQKNLCLAGGVALNCVANGRILREGPFDNVWIQPAAGDAGGALGAALYAWHQHLGRGRHVDGVSDLQRGSYLGPAFSHQQIGDILRTQDIPHTALEEDEVAEKVSDLIKEENVIGWFQGSMEFGPRALGSRSILGDARSEKMQSTMNLKIKFRESFRPFAPAVLFEESHKWFDIAGEREMQQCSSPYMLLVGPVREDKRRNGKQESTESLTGLDRLNGVRSEIPAATHVDYSARIQTVHRETNPQLHRLMEAFFRKTGCPVIINTSFNVRGEPIVCRPEEAYACFMRTDMDYLVLGRYLLDKKAQPEFREAVDWRELFHLD
jgi:carbamoyltransferase